MNKKEMLNIKVGDKVNIYGTICKVTKLDWINNNIEFDSDIYIGKFNLAQMLDEIFIVGEDGKHWTDNKDSMLYNKVLNNKVQHFINSQNKLKEEEKEEKEVNINVEKMKEFMRNGNITFVSSKEKELEEELNKKNIEILNLKNQLSYFTNSLLSTSVIQGDLAGAGIIEQIDKIDKKAVRVQDMYITGNNCIESDTISELNKKKNSFLNI